MRSRPPPESETHLRRKSRFQKSSGNSLKDGLHVFARDRAKGSASDRRSALAMRRSIYPRAWAACSAALSASLVAFESANPATPTRRPP